jgi:hypothetical protein
MPGTAAVPGVGWGNKRRPACVPGVGIAPVALSPSDWMTAHPSRWGELRPSDIIVGRVTPVKWTEGKPSIWMSVADPIDHGRQSAGGRYDGHTTGGVDVCAPTARPTLGRPGHPGPNGEGSTMKRTLGAAALAGVLVLAGAACSDDDSSDPADDATETTEPAKDPDDVFLTTLSAIVPGVLERTTPEQAIAAGRAACQAGTDEEEGADPVLAMREHLEASEVTADAMEAATMAGAAIAAYCPELRPGG